MGKIALVTGGTSGIGRATALGLAAAGYSVAVCGRRKAELDSMLSTKGVALALPCDVTDAADVARLFIAVRETFGRVDVVFNNAGRSSPAVSFGDIDIATWQDVVNTNLNGAFYVAREAF